ncbi:unnamed protein product, partial [Mesorhabditis belari]|uniref:Uncharacterized protein n=1 Tax=Mesorhabditis belari TaxID=2138241 RepID=A0AAF3FDI9_9BILA
MRSLIFGIFLGLFELIGAILPGNCTKCDAYKCFEEKLSCGPKGYFTAFGYPNCRRFNEDVAIARLSPTGKLWANCTTNCLLDAIEGIFMTAPATTCDQMKLLAFDSHVRCYVQCGFCDVCKTDKWALARTYNYCDFFSVAVLKQVTAIVKTCGLFSCFTW